MFKFFKRYLYKKTNKDYILYLETSKKSLNTMNACKMKSNSMEYVSQSKLENFMKDLGIERNISKTVKNRSEKSINASIELSLDVANAKIGKSQVNMAEIEKEVDIESAIEDIRNYLSLANNNLKTFHNVNKGEYFAIHFPITGGRLELSMIKKYPNTYFWAGKYRNLELFICGNIKNIRRQKCNNCDDYLWNPSSDGSSRVLFDAIEHRALEEQEISKDNNRIFELLSGNINEGTARKGKPNYGWKDMIIICDEKEILDDGSIRIFGSPVIVSANADIGYGWYNVFRKHICDKEKYFEYDGEKFTGRVLCKGYISYCLNGHLIEPIRIDINDIYKGLRIKGNEINSIMYTDLYRVEQNKIDEFLKEEINKKINYSKDVVGIVLTEKFLRNEIIE